MFCTRSNSLNLHYYQPEKYEFFFHLTVKITCESVVTLIQICHFDNLFSAEIDYIGRRKVKKATATPLRRHIKIQLKNETSFLHIIGVSGYGVIDLSNFNARASIFFLHRERGTNRPSLMPNNSRASKKESFERVNPVD